MNRNKLILLIIGALIVVTGCQKKKDYEVRKTSGVIWGTMYNITYNAAGLSDEKDANSIITAALNRIDNAANAFSKTTEISRLNRDGKLDNPSAEMQMLLNASRAISELSDGAFEPTIGPLVDAWGYGSGEQIDDLTQQRIDSVLALVGMNKLHFDAKRVEFSESGMRLDLAAIAKGAGVDAVAEALADAGISDFIVEIGGEVRVAGKSPRGTPWTVQIDAPITDDSGTHHQLAVVELSDAALATSGNYRNFHRNEAGELTYHTISPVTGRPVQTDILSATVVARQTMIADALATASMVLGLDKATRMIEKIIASGYGDVYGAIFVTENNGTFVLHPVALNTAHISFRE